MPSKKYAALARLTAAEALATATRTATNPASAPWEITEAIESYGRAMVREANRACDATLVISASD